MTQILVGKVMQKCCGDEVHVLVVALVVKSSRQLLNELPNLQRSNQSWEVFVLRFLYLQSYSRVSHDFCVVILLGVGSLEGSVGAKSPNFVPTL